MSRKNYNPRKKKPVLTCFVCGTKRYGAAALAKHVHEQHLSLIFLEADGYYAERYRHARFCWCGITVFDSGCFRKHLKMFCHSPEAHFLLCQLSHATNR